MLLSVVVYKRSEFFFLAYFSTDSEIAIYSIAFAATTALALLPRRSPRCVPAFATLFGAGEMDRLRSGFCPRAADARARSACRSPRACSRSAGRRCRLVYGDDYSGTEPVLLAMLAPLLLQPLLRVSEGILYGLGRVKFIVVAGLVATVVDVVLAFALIPSMDALGAAIANGAAILVAGVPCLVLAVNLHRPVAMPVGPLVRAVLVALAVAGAAWAGLQIGTVLAVLTGTLAFFAAALILRPLTATDAAWLSGGLGEHGPRGTAAAFVRRIGA